MIEASWSIEKFKGILEVGGPTIAILFAGINLFIDTRVRRVGSLMEFTKQHRELWIYFDEHPEFAPLLDKRRDLEKQPLSDAELRFANFLFLHLCAYYGATKAGILVTAEHLRDDWRELFSHPALFAAWEKMKHLHDRKFVAFVDGFLK